jgi:hypothetical protein
MEVLYIVTTLLVVLALVAVAAGAESRDGFTVPDSRDAGRSIGR